MIRLQCQFVASIIVLALMGTGAVSAVSTPFDASYSISEVSGNAFEVSVRLAVELTNLSGAETHRGVLRVLRDDAGESVAPHAEFRDISLPLGGSLQLTQPLLLTTSEYGEWEGGRPLPAEIEWFDENGVARVERLSLRYEDQEDD